VATGRAAARKKLRRTLHDAPRPSPTMKTFATLLCLLCSLPLLGGCTGGEIVGLHVAVQADGSAAVTARVLLEATTPSQAEVRGKGATWSSKRAALVYSQGAIAKLADFGFGDGSFVVKPSFEANKITVTAKRGEAVEWVSALVPPKDKRRELALVYDPLGKTRELGDVLRLEFVLPGDVNGSSVLPTARGVEAGREGNRAYLTIPVETARENAEALTWDITWR
jgi:hypothetical protein